MLVDLCCGGQMSQAKMAGKDQVRGCKRDI